MFHNKTSMEPSILEGESDNVIPNLSTARGFLRPLDSTATLNTLNSCNSIDMAVDDSENPWLDVSEIGFYTCTQSAFPSSCSSTTTAHESLKQNPCSDAHENVIAVHKSFQNMDVSSEIFNDFSEVDHNNNKQLTHIESSHLSMPSTNKTSQFNSFPFSNLPLNDTNQPRIFEEKLHNDMIDKNLLQSDPLENNQISSHASQSTQLINASISRPPLTSPSPYRDKNSPFSVLVIDDSIVSRRILSSKLTGTFYGRPWQVRSAENGEIALHEVNMKRMQ